MFLVILVYLRSHNPKVVSSNLAPATNKKRVYGKHRRPFFFYCQFRSTLGGLIFLMQKGHYPRQSNDNANYCFPILEHDRPFFRLITSQYLLLEGKKIPEHAKGKWLPNFKRGTEPQTISQHTLAQLGGLPSPSYMVNLVPASLSVK